MELAFLPSPTDPVPSPTGSISNSSFHSIKSVSNSMSGEHASTLCELRVGGEAHAPWGPWAQWQVWGAESPMGLTTKGVNTNMGHKALRQMPPDIQKEEPLCLTKWSSREGWHTGGLAEALLIMTPHQAGRKQRWGVGGTAPPRVLGLWCPLQS